MSATFRGPRKRGFGVFDGAPQDLAKIVAVECTALRERKPLASFNTLPYTPRDSGWVSRWRAPFEVTQDAKRACDERLSSNPLKP